MFNSNGMKWLATKTIATDSSDVSRNISGTFQRIVLKKNEVSAEKSIRMIGFRVTLDIVTYVVLGNSIFSSIFGWLSRDNNDHTFHNYHRDANPPKSNGNFAI